MYPNYASSNIFFNVFLFCLECFSIQTETSSVAVCYDVWCPINSIFPMAYYMYIVRDGVVLGEGDE